jgi:hypothetical protein
VLALRALILTFAASLSLAAAAQQDLSRHIYPLAPRSDAPPVVIDVTDSPESKQWAEAAKKLVEDWYPVVLALLSTQDYKKPNEIKLIFKKEIEVPAYASGDGITINAKWIAEHPDDLGMVIHELVHVLQQYPRNRANTGWLVEGIADFIRWWRYEPEGPRPRITENSKMTDGYRVTAHFLAWAGKKYDLRLVPSLDSVLRKGEDPMPVFEKLCGKPADEVWKEFVAATSR